MLLQSQPISAEYCKKLGLDKERDEFEFSDTMIKNQRIGKMFDDLLEAGKESGNDPREGYLEFVDGRFTLVESPDQVETDRVLTKIDRYNVEVKNAYKQAEIDSDRDFDRLAELLKGHLFSWWD